MKYLLTGVIALTLLTACGQKDKPTGEAALAAIEFDAADLADVRLRNGDPATAGAALSVFSLTDSGSGRLSFANSNVSGDKAVFNNVTLSAPELSSGAVDDDAPNVQAEKLEFDGLGMFDGQANFALMRLSGITVTPQVGSEDQTRGTIGSVELINPSPETAAWVASLLGKGEPADFPEGTALSFDRWAVKDVNLSVNDASGQGAFKLDSVFISDLSEEKAGRVGLSNLVFSFNEPETGDVNISLEGFGLAGINYGVLMAAANNSGNPSAAAEAFQVDPGNPGFDALNLKALKADIIGASLDLPSLTSTVSRDDLGRATKIVTKPFTMTLAARDNPDGEQFASALATLGYEKLTLSAAGEQQYDPDADIVTLPKGKNYWKLNDGFQLDMSAKYEGSKAIAAASLEAETNPDLVLDAMMNKLAFHQLELAFDDDGFFNRALNAYAAQSGEDPAQVRAQLSGVLAMAPMFASGTGIDTAVITELASALASFVQDPKTLTISLAPQTPLTAQTFMDAASDPSKKLDKTSLGFAAGNK